MAKGKPKELLEALDWLTPEAREAQAAVEEASDTADETPPKKILQAPALPVAPHYARSRSIMLRMDTAMILLALVVLLLVGSFYLGRGSRTQPGSGNGTDEVQSGREAEVTIANLEAVDPDKKLPANLKRKVDERDKGRAATARRGKRFYSIQANEYSSKRLAISHKRAIEQAGFKNVWVIAGAGGKHFLFVGSFPLGRTDSKEISDTKRKLLNFKINRQYIFKGMTLPVKALLWGK